MTLEPNLIGVDGGGTACRICLIWRGQRIEARMGGANVTTDPSGAVAAITEGLHDVARQADITVSQLRDCPTYLGLAGVVGPADGVDLAAALPLSRVIVADDRLSSMRGALGHGHGAVAAVGTGSFLGRLSDDGARFVGGWGLILGDQASGAWLGRGLLSASLDACDGLRRTTVLTDDVLKEFDGPAGLVAFARTASPAEFAAWAPRVIAAAQAEDPTALGLMGAGAAYLETALTTLDWNPAERLCLIGGVGPHFKPYLSRAVAAACVAPQGSALDGALMLAAEMAVAPP
ncbi:ATPase [Actibacterium sp. 188UL27-1]|nr:ATPase [Actibacterium sp. 188UL27-1]